MSSWGSRAAGGSRNQGRVLISDHPPVGTWKLCSHLVTYPPGTPAIRRHVARIRGAGLPFAHVHCAAVRGPQSGNVARGTAPCGIRCEPDEGIADRVARGVRAVAGGGVSWVSEQYRRPLRPELSSDDGGIGLGGEWAGRDGLHNSPALVVRRGDEQRDRPDRVANRWRGRPAREVGVEIPRQGGETERWAKH